MSRLQTRFAELKEQKRAALVTFLTAGDPDYDASLAILKGLPKAGADVIELGMPFTDPMADGPSIQLANIRALANKQDLAATLRMVRAFREEDTTTPIVLMGYFNPIHKYGVGSRHRFHPPDDTDHRRQAFTQGAQRQLRLRLLRLRGGCNRCRRRDHGACRTGCRPPAPPH